MARQKDMYINNIKRALIEGISFIVHVHKYISYDVIHDLCHYMITIIICVKKSGIRIIANRLKIG